MHCDSCEFLWSRQECGSDINVWGVPKKVQIFEKMAVM